MIPARRGGIRLTSNTLGHIPGYVPAAFHALVHPMPERALDPAGPVNQCGFDIVTIVFAEELELLALQARSFASFLDDTFSGRILVIVNDLQCARVMRTIESAIVPLYGRWQKRVGVVPFHRIAHRLDPSNGWIIQQALKLTASRMIDRAHYVVFDAKNHLIAPVGRAQFFDVEGRARQAFQTEPSCMAQHHAKGADYFGLEPDDGTPQFVPMTPFVLHTETARALVRYVEAREQADLSDFFCDTKCISEFLLYGSFLARTPDLLRGLYVDALPLAATIWKDGGSIADAIARAADPDIVCFGLHREVLKRLDAAQAALLVAFWRERGLLRPGETRRDLLPSDRVAGRIGQGLAAALLAAFVVTKQASLSIPFGGNLLLVCVGAIGLWSAGALRASFMRSRLVLAGVRLAGPSFAIIALLAMFSIWVPPPGAPDLLRSGGPTILDALLPGHPPPPRDPWDDWFDGADGPHRPGPSDR